ncbi:hypothetical protein SteCoe_416 [Stentor coeruleus]|uniref:NADH dehydrogenase [ubiquinone] iron-sulfur protein 5 n=1 Tax=Stentor coeruleus TaxID=5963 RepID=A0A1R2D442_9CILI|nr:hypothetical protein SteCoe_416 [Stentor coeruleus]
MSMFHGMSLDGGVQRCFPFWLKFVDCYKGEDDPGAMCREDFQDFHECSTRNKEMRLNYRINEELHKWKILAIPRYNELTDSFEPVSLPADPDAYFH